MKNIYRTVSVGDRLPETEGRYVVFNHGQWHESDYCKQYSFHEEMTDCSGVTHWMEEVELPTEEEMDKAGDEFSSMHIDGAFAFNAFMHGASFVINHIK